LWLCQQFPEAGSYVFRDLLEPDPAQRTFAVRREVRQLDLVIELPGFRPLVIENKVFSLPDESSSTGMPGTTSCRSSAIVP